MDTLPLKLKHDNVADAIIEVRFDTNTDPNVLFALIYAKVKERLKGKVQSLPFPPVPAVIIRKDQSLKYRPLYRVDGDDCTLQIGAQMIALNSTIPYIGWGRFYDLFEWVLGQSFDILGNVQRLGLRYVNFFDENISNQVNIAFELLGSNNKPTKFHIQTEVETGEFKNTIQYSPSVLQKLDNNSIQGSIIDIDTYKVYSGDKCTMKDVLDDLVQAHQCEKQLFFSLLKNDLLKKMEPEF